MRDNKLLYGKNTIITGCGSGIGLEILHTFCRNGANAWALVHKETSEFNDVISKLMEETNCWIKTIQFDLLNTDSIKDAVKAISKDKKTVDILVNNAGISCQKPLLLTSVDEIKTMMDANFIAPSLLMQLVSRLMVRNRHGNIINVTSRSGIEDRSGIYGYGSSKAALIWATKATAREFADFNIRVNGIAPGLTDTRMGSLTRTEEEIKAYVDRNDIKRPGRTEEVANVALFLASELSSYVTGQIISVDGGRN